MSHEIRTPMNAILGMSYLMRREGVTAGQAVRLDRIETAGQHLSHLINSVLDLSRIESGKVELEDSPLNVNSVIQAVTGMLAESARSKQIQLVTEVSPFPDGLMGDPSRLQQALLNYVGNSIKFTGSGTVTVRASPAEETSDSVLVGIEVEDTGTGISPEAMPRLFEAFQQADNTITRTYGGTGLGLSITKRLVTLMGGEVGASSTPGKGSTFWLTVRLTKRNPVEQVSAVSPTVSAEAILVKYYPGRRILLVEDQPINREVCVEILQYAAQNVDVAEDGLQAIASVTSNAYDLILMDVHMPNLDGLEATRRIRQLANGQSVPIIAMTADAFAQDRANCIEAGMDDFVAKPFIPEELYSKLIQFLARGNR
jgi:CheY-like chemotaxis protein